MSIDSFLGSVSPLSDFRDHDKAADTARTIAEKSDSITIYRDGSAQTAQTVRIDPLSASAAMTMGFASQQTDLMVLITGYKDHASIADTDIQAHDRFVLNGTWYTVQHVVPDVTSRMLAIAEASPA